MHALNMKAFTNSRAASSCKCRSSSAFNNCVVLEVLELPARPEALHRAHIITPNSPLFYQQLGFPSPVMALGEQPTDSNIAVQGLAGLDIGSHLIKRAAADLVSTHPSLNLLVTLSPIPGFSRWLDGQLLSGSDLMKELFPVSGAAITADSGLDARSGVGGSAGVFAWTSVTDRQRRH